MSVWFFTQNILNGAGSMKHCYLFGKPNHDRNYDVAHQIKKCASIDRGGGGGGA